MEVSDRIEIKVIAAKNLPLYEGIEPDVYAEVVVGADQMRTNVVGGTMNPTWSGQNMVFSYLLVNASEEIMINVKHKDKNSGKQTTIASGAVSLSTSYNAPRVELDDWYPLFNTLIDEASEASVRVKMTYFNTLDEDMTQSYVKDVGDAPNLLVVTLGTASGFPGGSSVEAFCVVQVGDLRKETKASKRSPTPTWDEELQLPCSDGKELIDITVKQSTLIRGIFMGKVRLSLNEIAASGEQGYNKTLSLYNESLQFEEKGHGKLSVCIKWTFDVETDEENKRRAQPKKVGILGRMARALFTSAKAKPVAAEEKGEAETSPMHTADLPSETLDMSPYELEQYLREQTELRQKEVEDLMKINEQELEIKEGDYTIQVHIVEVADIKGANMSGMSDPFVVVEVMGQRYKTRYVKEVVSAFFNETFYFNFKDLKREQIAEAHMKLYLYDHNWFRSNELIGTYQIDLLSAYNQPDHEMYRRWANMRDPINKSEHGSQGLLKFSCTVLGPGDTQKVHDPALEEEAEDDRDMEHLEGAGVADQGSGMAQSLQFLVLSVLRVDGLPGFDKLTTILGSKSGLYAFVSLEFAGCKPIKTTKVSVTGRKNLTISFDEELWIPVWVPTLSKRAAITIMNREFGRSDLVVATVYVDFDDVLKCDKDPINSTFMGFGKKKYNGPNFQWMHFYGANPLVRMGPKQAQFMNRFPNYGSAYRGSMLASLRVVKHSGWGAESAHKKTMSYDIPESLLPKPAAYLLRLMAYQGSDFGSRGAHASSAGPFASHYAVGVSIGPHELRTKFGKYEMGSVDWVDIVEGSNLLLYADMRQLPETIITVYRGSESSNTPVAFARIKTLSILQTGLLSPPIWYELQHDLSYRNSNAAGYPGCVLMKVALSNVHDVHGAVDWEPERKKIVLKKAYALRVYVYQCRGLPAIDDNGLIDPYVKVRFAGQKEKTQVRKQCQNPTFYECLEFSALLPDDLRLAPNVILQLWDNKSLGRTPVAALRVACSDVTITSSILANPPSPKWVELKGIDGHGSMGEVLVSMQLIPKKDLQQTLAPPKDITPQLKKVWLDIHVVGLRNLQKIGYSSIRKPFIKFDVASHSFGESIQTSQSALPSASNPNFLDRYILQTMVPEDASFAPTLEVRCYDQRLRTKQLIGNANIDLRTKLPWNGEEYVPPRQHRIMQDNLKAKEAIEIAKIGSARKKAQEAAQKSRDPEDSAEEEEVDEQTPLIEDGGLGVFPPEVGALEPGSKYAELPSIMDEEEMEAQLGGAGGGAGDALGTGGNAADLAQLGESSEVRNNQLKRIIGFPSAWASTEYLKGREWWIQSKKKGWGGSLEEYMKTYPFENYDLYRGHIAFNKYGRRRDTTKKVGLLKAVIRVCQKNPRYDTDYGKFSRSIRQVTNCVVRLYVLKARNLMPQDFNGFADPYLKVSLGTNEQRDMKSLNKKTLNPDFFSSFQFNTTLPGPSLLKVQIFDQNNFTSDRFMGETIIDLEDRFFHPKWTSLGDIKPVENRNIFKDGSQTTQGVTTLWVDVLTAQEAQNTPPVVLAGPETKKFEIRIVCWRSLNVPCMDGEFSDLFVKFFMEGTDVKYDTDTHWRCKNGSASWNWRIKIPIELPIKERELGRLRIQMWERNIITSNEIVGEHTVNLYDWLMLTYKRVAQPVFPFQERRNAEKKLRRGLGDFEDDDEDEDDDDQDGEGNAADDDTPDGEASPDGASRSPGGEGDEDDEGDEAPLLKAGRTVVEASVIDEKEDPNDKKLRKKLKGDDAEEEGEGEGEEKKKKKSDVDDEDEPSDVQKLVSQINQYFGIGDSIADDAEWVKISFHDRKRGRTLDRGKLAISVSIVPQSEVESRPVGSGRDEPNVNPYLPPPFGRFSFSLNPLTLIRELCGWRVLCCLLCCCCCICLLATFMFAATYLSGIESIISLTDSSTDDGR